MDTGHALIPNMRSHLAEARRSGELLLNGEFRTGLYRGRSLLLNFWNFQLRQNTYGALCPCCLWQGPAFIALSNWRGVEPQSRCPRCSSRSRHRGLAIMLPELIKEKPEGEALIFAPEPPLLSLMVRLTNGQTATTDYLRADVDFPGEDIQALGFGDESYSFLMCNHVLEHIPDDQRAIDECARILVPGGIAVFTIPGDFSQQNTWTFAHPDSNGHYRHYGLDIVEKLKQSFTHVATIDMGAGQDPRWHIRPGDLAFICRK